MGLWYVLACPTAYGQTPEDTPSAPEARYYDGTSGTMRGVDLDKEPKVREYLFAGYKYKEIDSIIYYFDKSLEFATASADDYFLPTIYYALAGSYVNTGDKELVLKYANLLLDLATQHNLPVYMFEAYRLLGLNYSYFYSDYDKALEYYKQAIIYAEDNPTALRIKLDIAWMYTTANAESEAPDKYDIVKTFLNEIETHFDTVPRPTRYDVLHISYGANLCYSGIEEEYKIKTKYAAKALEDAYRIDSIYTEPASVAAALNNLASIHLSYSNYISAKDRIQESLALAQQHNDQVRVNQSYINLAMANYGLKDYASVITYLDSVKAATTTPIELATIDSLYYKSYLKLKDYEKAATYAERYIAVIDSINKAEKQNAYVEFGKKYQTEKKIQENKILTQENEIKDLTINKEKNRRIFFAALAIMSLLILGILYYFYRNKQRTAKVLQEKNETISLQNQELNEANRTKQKFFSIISHDLVNPFNAMLGYAQLLDTSYDDFDDQQKKNFITNIHDSAAHNYKLVKSLLTWGRTQQDAIVAKKETLNCRDLIDLACEPFLSFAAQKDMQLHNHAPEDLSCIADKNMMVTCIGNIVNNAIKFTPKGGTITIDVRSEGSNLHFDIKDSGIGIPQAKMAQLFAIDKVTSSRGTDEKGTGFGLMITKEFMQKQGGDVQVAPNSPTGTAFTLVLPLR